MRRTLGLLSLVGIVAMAVATSNTSGLLANLSKALQNATAIESTYTVQTIGGPAESYTVTLKKPNLAKVETPRQIVVADGTTMTVFDKSEKTFYKKAQTDAELKTVFTPDELNLFAGFFRPDAYNSFREKDLGAKTVKGAKLNAVEATITANGRKVVTYFIDPSDNVARKSQIDLNDSTGKVTTIVDTKSLRMNSEISQDAFRFKAPEGSREISEEDLNVKWYEDLEEAKKVAAKTNRKIFVDFYADWCVPCKKLEKECFSTSTFKAYSKKLVFLRIDVDKQTKVSEQYKIEAMPTQMVLDAKGGILKTKVGYANPSDFFAFLKEAVGN